MSEGSAMSLFPPLAVERAMKVQEVILKAVLSKYCAHRTPAFSFVFPWVARLRFRPTHHGPDLPDR